MSKLELALLRARKRRAAARAAAAGRGGECAVVARGDAGGAGCSAPLAAARAAAIAAGARERAAARGRAARTSRRGRKRRHGAASTSRARLALARLHAPVPQDPRRAHARRRDERRGAPSRAARPPPRPAPWARRATSRLGDDGLGRARRPRHGRARRERAREARRAKVGLRGIDGSTVSNWSRAGRPSPGSSGCGCGS